MKAEDAKKKIDDLALEATADEDGLLAVYFSREDEKFVGQNVGIDGADAMIVIRNLINIFALDPEFIAHLADIHKPSIMTDGKN